MSGGCLSLFGLPFLLAGLFLSGLYFRGFSDWWQARNWVEVPCWIESAELKTSQGDDSTSYQAIASYRYEFQGNIHRGERVSFGEGSDNVGNFQQNAYRELARHVIGPSGDPNHPADLSGRRPFRCYVDPEQPNSSVLYRVLRWPLQAFMAVFALTFPAVGAALVAGGLIAARSAKKDLALQIRNPDQPWLWKSEWTGAAIPESLGPWRTGVLLYTLWAALVIFPLIFASAVSGAFKEDPKAWLLLGFLLGWCAPAWISMQRLRQYFAIGTPRFELAETPAAPGSILKGNFLLERPLSIRSNAEVTLTCARQLTRKTGDGNSSITEKIWNHSQPVVMDQITHDFSGFRLPVSIPLPPDAPQSGISDDPAISHVWKLGLRLAGIVNGPMFEIPVFRRGRSSDAAVETLGPAISIHEAALENLPAALAARRIKAEFDSNGFPSSILCPPARHRGLIISLFLFDLIWTGVAVFLLQSDAPLLFRIVWPVSAGGIWLVLIYQILHRREVTFQSDGLKISNNVGPWNREEMIEKTKIASFSHDTNMQSNQNHFYRVRVEDVFGKKKTLVDGITEANTAAALASRLEEWKVSRV